MFEASLGPAQHHQNLTIFPILAEKPRELPYVLMAEALALGILSIGEKDGGEVPLLLATNAGRESILILDGEQLIGAKQNRMTNRSILLPPETITEIPVSCMEQGRWHHVSRNFASAPQHAPSKVRRRTREVERDASARAERSGPGSRSSHRDLAAAQGQVWEEIRVFEGTLGRASDTGALDALYESRRGRMDEWVAAFPRLDGQTGLMAFLDDTPLAMDAVGSPALWAKLHDRLLSGYVLDAMEGRKGEERNQEGRNGAGQNREGRDGEGRDPAAGNRDGWPRENCGDPLTTRAGRFMEALGEAERVRSDSVGNGEYRILRGEVLGGELVDQDRMVHVSAFPAQLEHRGDSGGRPNGQNGGPIARPSYRRRRGR